MESKKFTGAPFGTQKCRFEVAGIHPKRRPPGSITQVFYDKTSMTLLNRDRGPGTYNIDSHGSFSSNVISKQASGPGWRKAYETSEEAKMPHLLYREEWKRKQLQKCLLGPGAYNIPDSFAELGKKPGSQRGICQTRARRFTNIGESDVPGPGTYGKGGIPQALMEEKQLKSASTVGLLDAGASGKRQLPEIGSALCPGQYNCKSFTDEMAERVVSKRGPYDLFTGDRNNPISVGHFAVPNRSNLGPGQYEVRSFIDNLSSEHKKRQGRFGKVERHLDVSLDRMYCKTLSQMTPRKSDEPGPGSCDQQAVLGKPESSKRPPFGSSAERSDKSFLGGSSTVGPGRYNITASYNKQHKNGSKSVFNSNTKRWDPNRDKYLMERIRSKDVPLKDRNVLVPTEA